MPRVAPADGTSTQADRRRKAWAVQDHRLRAPWTFRSKEVVQCICEGGPFCSREDPAKQRTGNAIPGLHSSWVGDQKMVLAMARPWQRSLQEYAILDAFVKQNIGMVLNLQEVGEHQSCGPGNMPASGFSYLPESFMSARVGFYNFGWVDMGVPDLDRMMDIVQVMDYVTGTEGRKVAVHCHAGLGRTGLAIACFFLYSQHYTPRRAVETVRRDRPGALQTRRQEMFVYIFEQYLAHLRCLFNGRELQVAEVEQQQCTSANKGSASLASHSTPLSGSTLPGHGAAGAGGKGSGGMGPVEAKESGGVLTQVFGSGLTIVRPAKLPASAAAAHRHGASSPAAKRRKSTGSTGAHNGGGLGARDLGLDHQLPWNEGFDIQPSVYSKDWLPHAPVTYQEALRRQQRLLHGPQRRSFLYLHWFVKEAVFTIIAAAQAYELQSTGGAPAAPGGMPVAVNGSSAPAAGAYPSNPAPYQGAATGAPAGVVANGAGSSYQAVQGAPAVPAVPPAAVLVPPAGGAAGPPMHPSAALPSTSVTPSLAAPAPGAVPVLVPGTYAGAHGPAAPAGLPGAGFAPGYPRPVAEALEAVLWPASPRVGTSMGGAQGIGLAASLPVPCSSQAVGARTRRRGQPLPRWWLQDPCSSSSSAQQESCQEQGHQLPGCSGCIECYPAASATLQDHQQSHAYSPLQTSWEGGLEDVQQLVYMQQQQQQQNPFSAESSVWDHIFGPRTGAHHHQWQPPYLSSIQGCTSSSCSADDAARSTPPRPLAESVEATGLMPAPAGAASSLASSKAQGARAAVGQGQGIPGPSSGQQWPALQAPQANPAGSNGSSVAQPAAVGGAGKGKGGSAVPTRFTSFAHALASCVAGPSPVNQLDPAILTALSSQAEYTRFTGAPKADWGALKPALLRAKRAANFGDLSALQASPLIVALSALEDFFSGLTHDRPALSIPALKVAASTYQSLPYEVGTGPEPPQFAAALKHLESVPAPDQELLLLFACLLRTVAAASGGPGSEAHVVTLGRWVVRLLLGSQLASHPAAQEAVLSYLWYYVRNDVAYGSLILSKNERIERRRHRGMSKPGAPPTSDEDMLTRTQARTRAAAAVAAATTEGSLPAMPARDPASLQASIAAASQQPQTPVTAPAAAYPMRAEAVSSIMMPGDPGTPYARGEVMVPASRAMAAGSQPPPGQLPPPQAPPPPGFIATKSVMMDGRTLLGPSDGPSSVLTAGGNGVPAPLAVSVTGPALPPLLPEALSPSAKAISMPGTSPPLAVSMRPNTLPPLSGGGAPPGLESGAAANGIAGTAEGTGGPPLAAQSSDLLVRRSARLRVSTALDGSPDPRLYGSPSAAALAVSNRLPPLRPLIPPINSAPYVPPTAPGASQVVVHDVWM